MWNQVAGHLSMRRSLSMPGVWYLSRNQRRTKEPPRRAARRPLARSGVSSPAGPASPASPATSRPLGPWGLCWKVRWTSLRKGTVAIGGVIAWLASCEGRRAAPDTCSRRRGSSYEYYSRWSWWRWGTIWADEGSLGYDDNRARQGSRVPSSELEWYSITRCDRAARPREAIAASTRGKRRRISRTRFRVHSPTISPGCEVCVGHTGRFSSVLGCVERTIVSGLRRRRCGERKPMSDGSCSRPDQGGSFHVSRRLGDDPSFQLFSLAALFIIGAYPRARHLKRTTLPLSRDNNWMGVEGIAEQKKEFLFRLGYRYFSSETSTELTVAPTAVVPLVEKLSPQAVPTEQPGRIPVPNRRPLP